MVRNIYNHIIKQILNRLTKGEKINFNSTLVRKVRAADLAEIIATLSEDKQLDIFQTLELERKCDVFSELPEEIQDTLVQEIGGPQLLALLKELPPDEAVDLLNLLEEKEQKVLLQSLSKNQSSKLQQLLLYGKECAGGIMTPILIAAKKTNTTSEVIDMIREKKDEDDLFLNIFVIDDKGCLIGVVPLQDLVTAYPETLISDIMETEPIAVSVQDDQELVAQIVTKYNLFVVPVIDPKGVLVGRVTPDDVLDVVQTEAQEDVYKMAGISGEEVQIQSVVNVAKARLPWLLVCLVGTMFSALVLNQFEHTLAKVVGLVLFLPAICAMGGNSGLQTCTITIRNLTYGYAFFNNLKRLVIRELMTGLFIGIICGVTVGFIAHFWLNKPIYGVIVGMSMIFTILISMFTGLMFPLIFHKLGIDPAVASGPMITTLNDTTSIFTYLTLATLTLKYCQLI